MGKLFDAREVEYAYVNVIEIVPNRTRGEGRVHVISIFYELKDKDRATLGEKKISHEIATTDDVMQTVPDILAAIQANLPELIAQDKENLSGYKSTDN